MAAQQRLRTDHVTAQESIMLVRNLMRVGVSTAAFLRRIFPDQAFTDKTISGVCVKSLMPVTEESCLVTKWLEQGVFDALQKQYLRTMSLVVLDGSGSEANVIESYDFRVTYPATGGAEVAISKKSAQGKEEAVRSMQAMLHNLVMLTRSMHPLPDTRVITMRLVYTDATPEGYDPPFFCAAPPEARQHYTHRNPGLVKVKLGAMATSYHSMDLRCFALADVFEDTIEESADDLTPFPDPSVASAGELQAMRLYMLAVRCGTWQGAAEHIDDIESALAQLQEWGIDMDGVEGECAKDMATRLERRMASAEKRARSCDEVPPNVATIERPLKLRRCVR